MLIRFHRVILSLPLTFCLFAFIFVARKGYAQNGKVRVESITVLGNKKTKPNVIIRELPFKAGDSLFVDRLEEVKQKSDNNIYNLGLFNEVLIKDSVDLENKQVYFTLRVIERWYIWPQPYVGFEERTFSEWWADKDFDRLVYGLGVTIQNLTGRNETLDLYGQSGYSRRASFTFIRPYIMKKWRADLKVGYRYKNLKEIGYGTIGGVLQLARLGGKLSSMQESHQGIVELHKRFSLRKIMVFGLKFDYFIPSDSVAIYNDKYISHAEKGVEHYPSFYIEFENDQRDLRSWPMQGFKYELIARYSGLPGVSTTQFGRISATFSHHIPLSKRFNIAYGTYNFLLIGKRVPYFDKYFIGFDYWVRGYERYVIDGSFITINKFELKFAVFPRKILHAHWIPFKRFRDFPFGLYLTAFTDAGCAFDNTFNNTDKTLKNYLLTGVGLGINVITLYDIQIRAEYSWNHLGQSGYFLGTTLSLP